MKQLHSNTPENWILQQQQRPTQNTPANSTYEAVCLTSLYFFLEHIRKSKEIIYINAHTASKAVAQNTFISFAQRIDEIRNVLAINISDLATILDVTRPTIYAFMAGNEPVDDAETKYARMEMLQLLSELIVKYNLPIPCNQILRRRNQHGESLKDLLSKGLITKNELESFVKAEVVQQQENERRATEIRKNRKTQKRKDPETISIPFHRE